MSAEITDRQLLQLIQGELPEAEERRLEDLLSLDAQLRIRLDRLSGGDQWLVGSAPIPPPHQSARLSKAIEHVSQYIDAGTESTDQQQDSAQLPTLSGITLVRQIGQGGMGIVYEGIDDALGRRVAVKFIQPMRAASPEARERLIREAKATAALQHDNIVTIHAIQSVDGTPALIQQYVDGSTLQQILDSEGALPIARCIDLARQLAQGLAAAHAAGIVHRDLKPGNVLIEKLTGKARLADFGMAKHIADLQLSSSDVVSGTPAYMSPEQTRGAPTDGRSDLFSLGAILYTAIAGKTPFRGDDPFVVMEQVRAVVHTPLSNLRPESPAWLNNLVDRLLVKSVADRFPSAEGLLKLLDTSSNQRTMSLKSLALSLAGVCLLIGVLAYSWWPSAKQTPQPADAVFSTQSATTDAAPAIWIGEPGRSYATLISAVKDAVDGDVITIARDLVTEQVDIVGKRLTIRAAADTQPTIRPTAWAVEYSPFLFRADRDLTLQGLSIDWQVKTVPLSDPGATLSAVVAVTQPDMTLQVEDCVISRTEGMCIASAGDLNVLRCHVTGGKFAIGWVANNNRLEVTDCRLECESSLVVIFPPAGAAYREPATIRFQKCTSIGQGFVDFILFRHIDHAVELIAEKCTFEVERMVQLSGTTIVASLNLDMVAQAIARATLRWQENECVHQLGIEYIASRRIRGANRWMMGGVRGLEAWQEFWNVKSDGPPAVRDAREVARATGG